MMFSAEHVSDAIKVAPPVVITVSSIAGVHWSTVSYVLASAYSALMFALTLWDRVVKPWLQARKEKQA
jgi:hypothetical protein